MQIHRRYFVRFICWLFPILFNETCFKPLKSMLPKSLSNKTVTSHLQSLFLCSIRVSEQTAIIYTQMFSQHRRVVYCAVQTNSRSTVGLSFAFKSRVMAQAVSRGPLTVRDKVPSQDSPCGTFGPQSGSGTGFSTCTSAFACIIPPVLHTRLHPRENVALSRRTNGWSLETFQKAIVFRKLGSIK